MSQPKKSEISERFILFRARARITQGRLADLLGITNDYVSLIEGGKKEPGQSLLKLFTLMEDEQKRTLFENSTSTESAEALREVFAGPAPVPTQADCIRYLEAYLKEAGGDLGKIAWV